MTARQRAKREKELGEDEGLIDDGLLSLPDGQVKVKPILTEAERLQKREEMARRRKRQNEQRLQDEQVSRNPGVAPHITRSPAIHRRAHHILTKERWG